MIIQRGNTSVSNTSNSNEANHYINFQGVVIETTVTRRALVVESWIREIYSAHSGTRIIVALDFKGKVARQSRGEGILSMCVDKKCLVLQLCHMDSIPSTLQNFLNDTQVMFIAVKAGRLIGQISLGAHSIDCSRTLDAVNLARRSVHASLTAALPGAVSRPLELDEFAKHVLGFEIEKPHFVIESNWEASELFVEQIRYASIDAYATYKIGQKLLSANH